ncbi:MAG: hypothetical protein PHT77_08770 [Bacteroidales bacterium]|nr:hypothetical protein [Bacteroidales bacterium]MDD3961942.1 hypothetical protein [Bacteroidales bacterium]MDY0285435.1 hypothetical protein [Bacteroidales bacterium]
MTTRQQQSRTDRRRIPVRSFLTTTTILLLLPLYSLAQFPTLAQKTVDVRHTVYQLLKYYETKGKLEMLPQAKPYSNEEVVCYLEILMRDSSLLHKDHEEVEGYLSEFTQPVNGMIFKQQKLDNHFAAVGAAASMQGSVAGGDHATWSTSNIIEPFIAAQLGDHISAFGALGLGIERLAPDCFYESYVKNGAVHFPYEEKGYACHPYTYDYETMYGHVNIDASSGEGNPLYKNLTAGMLYHAEISGSWWGNALRISFHNNRRAWGYSNDNLMLSSTARRMPGLDMVITPVSWLRYSMLIGSTFHYANQRSTYKSNIYGYDLGDVQKMLTLQLLEVMPWPWLQLSLSGGNIWSKRLELAYMMPFAFPHFTQIDVGDHDNLFMGTTIGARIPGTGKVWFSLWIDEFSITHRDDPLLKMPRNRYAWQTGWDAPLPVPRTTISLSYTRVTPYVYTHYPEYNFNTLTGRPLDMTYTHDGANIGFYLPPNSAEARLSIVTQFLPATTLKLESRYILHGTNDLAIAGDSLLITGDIYRYQENNVYDYPLLDFGRDGIYDHTWYTSLMAEHRIRPVPSQGYYRIFANLGYSHTRWEANQSGVTAPDPQKLFTFSAGLFLDF